MNLGHLKFSYHTIDFHLHHPDLCLSVSAILITNSTCYASILHILERTANRNNHAFTSHDMGEVSNAIRQCISIMKCAIYRKKRGLRYTSDEDPTNISEKDSTCSSGRESKEVAVMLATAQEKPHRGWKYRPDAEFPWRFAQVVQEEEKWRGTWVPELKNQHAMNWESSMMCNEDGKVSEYTRRPTRQLPFPVDGSSPDLSWLGGGQDNLLVYCGKQ